MRFLNHQFSQPSIIYLNYEFSQPSIIFLNYEFSQPLIIYLNYEFSQPSIIYLNYEFWISTINKLSIEDLEMRTLGKALVTGWWVGYLEDHPIVAAYGSWGHKPFRKLLI